MFRSHRNKRIILSILECDSPFYPLVIRYISFTSAYKLNVSVSFLKTKTLTKGSLSKQRTGRECAKHVVWLPCKFYISIISDLVFILTYRIQH